ncbi:MAG: HAD family phosphatase [Microcystis panniformis Mp_MB_F_20051200_S9]|uniref:HAD family phosphatase n=1 Tax=Microcystis panniformis Mp_MB_F_20051200_S9 TaxID=2486223 RepID=A0A552PIQ4_9CHRO|nr:MAG: HAD family phosphatase [Microcystis panniformis Mp_MB_F_20080800_S26D]TRV44980.1 MAG: HAD family phosphatase [Microcystis panniformis Mp_GB_SS_20050300_S99]TRV54976.1 MAG: HAD family phosphatase [Microcystis panniformis Mp_GB_SS_20050300_S99D]TRV56825.1 MAG: HAD family phosphatase [Microcystis panniformis Mp_MB_F_20051200_S9]TRV64378.1 MAG: HAD family phosphatase [Microcystis panniformis Mp_MB_F_20080800_S26]TRV67447.1 MAG: HAD family phosphatase [Microcystis panniformis Mp_MB_F_200512
MLKAVLFDFNGVIINDEPIHQELINEILLGENLLPLGSEFAELCLGRSDRVCLRNVLTRRGRQVTEEYLTKLINKKASLYRERLEKLEKLPIYEEIYSFLKRVKARELQIGLVTGAIRSEVESILQRVGLGDYFSVIVTGDEISTSKPQPDGYLLAVERFNRWNFNLQLQPQECLVIEDTFAGCEAAKRAGMQVVGIAHTYPFHFMQRVSNWAIDNFSQLDLDRVEETFSQIGDKKERSGF